MNHRHLLPDEIDQLVDSEAGFGIAPLKAHLRECADCHAQVEDARRLVSALEHLPHLAPSALFAERVMAQVQVFEPWHVAARDTARQFTPRSQPARVAIGAAAASGLVAITALTAWLGTNADLAVFLADAGLERARLGAAALAGSAFGGVLGEGVAAVSGGGAGAMAVAVTALGVAVVGVAAGLRSLAAVSRQRRH